MLRRCVQSAARPLARGRFTRALSAALPSVSIAPRASLSKTTALRFNGSRTLITGASPVPVRRLSSELPAGAQVISMPALSPTMEMGNIISWEVSPGDKVLAGAELAQIETDKAQLALDALEDGYLAAILVEAGARDVKVGTPICIIVEEEGDVAAAQGYVPEESEGGGDAQQQQQQQQQQESAPVAPPAAAPKPTATASSTATSTTTTATASSSKSASSKGGAVRATPAARALARSMGVDLSGVSGSGPGGRIVLEDVEKSAGGAGSGQGAVQQQQQQQPMSPMSGVPAAYEDVPNSQVRRVIAARLTESKQKVPHFYLTVDVQLDNIMRVRSELNATSGKAGAGEFKLSINDFVLKACASALRSVPGVNAQWGEDAIRHYSDVDISVAVDSPVGLTTPIVRNADRLGLVDISTTVKTLATKAAERKLVPEDYQGGTFSVSNLGMFGVKHFTAIINPPQACILAVGAARDEVVPDEASESGFAVRKVMSVTLSCDHRVVDGALGAKWLQKFKANMENPINMIM